MTQDQSTPANAQGVSELTDRFIASVLPPLSEREITIACLAIGYVTARPSGAEAKVVVKPLEWTDNIATRPFGSYTTCSDADDLWHFTFHCYPYGEEDENGWGREDFAKAAAQADYERRILSALASPVQQDSGWRSMDSAPVACHVLASYWDNEVAEWIYSIEFSPPSAPFTHWMPLPNSPSKEGA